MGQAIQPCCSICDRCLAGLFVALPARTTSASESGESFVYLGYLPAVITTGGRVRAETDITDFLDGIFTIYVVQ